MCAGNQGRYLSVARFACANLLGILIICLLTSCNSAMLGGSVAPADASTFSIKCARSTSCRDRRSRLPMPRGMPANAARPRF